MNAEIVSSLIKQSIEFTDDAVFVISKTSKIEWANFGAEKIFGYSRDELAGMDVNELLPERFRLGHGQKAEEFIREGHVVVKMREPNGTALRKNGEEFNFEASLTRVVEGTGEYYAVILRDLSQTLQLKNERVQLQRQLEQAYKLQLLGQFTSGITHDFNNILATIMGYNGLIERHVYDKKDLSKLLEYSTEVANAAKRGRDLVAQMLAFARNESNKFEKQDVVSLVKQTLKMIHPVIPSSISVDTKLPEEEILLKVDGIKISQVIMNLCINARDAVKGKGQITLAVQRETLHSETCNACGEPVAGKYVVVKVTDTGSGILPERMKNLFDPFFTTKQNEGGTGLGLSMVKAIVHEHHGHIVIRSEENAGSEFAILLPEEEQIVLNQDRKPLTAMQPNAEVRLLVVDDEVSVTRFLKELFQAEGYVVTAATDSRRALQEFLADPNRYSLIITDQTMPGLTGIEMVREIRKNIKSVPIILCTGYSEQVDEVFAKKEGVDEFLAKPVDPFKLRDLVNSMVKGHLLH